jgi:Do/DeqQ family serine protease
MFVAGPEAAAKSSRETPVVVAVRKAAPAVVNISCDQVVETAGPLGGLDPFFEGFFRDFFEPRLRRKVTLTSLGSGVIIDGRRGYIVTNEHVVRRATGIKVVLADGRTLEASLVGADPDFDLAVLRVETKTALPEVPFGTAENLMIGETVIAIGNPFGFSHSVTTGVVSATHRSVKGAERLYSDFIQTDASINPGNSGGPLLDINGELVGVNTAIYAKAQGIGFAIPIERVRRITRALIEHGVVLPAWLGLEVQDAPGPGAAVSYLIPEGPAARAGLQVHDLILVAAGEPVGSADHFRQLVASHTQGEHLALKFSRGAKHYRVTVVAAAFPLKEADAWAWRALGLKVIDLSAQTVKALRLGQTRGALVREVRSGSPAARAGLAPWDLIRRLGEGRVASVADFRKAVAAAASQENVSVLIQRGGYEGYVDLSL